MAWTFFPRLFCTKCLKLLYLSQNDHGLMTFSLTVNHLPECGYKGTHNSLISQIQHIKSTSVPCLHIFYHLLHISYHLVTYFCVWKSNLIFFFFTHVKVQPYLRWASVTRALGKSLPPCVCGQEMPLLRHTGTSSARFLSGKQDKSKIISETKSRGWLIIYCLMRAANWNDEGQEQGVSSDCTQRAERSVPAELAAAGWM